MAKLKRNQINSLKYSLSKKARGISGERIDVLEIASGNEIGFITEANQIFLSFEHDIFKDLSVAETLTMIKGTFAHEILHKLLSDFNILSRCLSKYKGARENIIKKINNILEDSYIEHYGPIYISETLMKNLAFMRAHVYKVSPRIDELINPYSQFIGASIQFGDAGLIKGEFTDELAKECFYKALPTMVKGLKEEDAEKRFCYAEEIFEISKPLWENSADLEDFFNDILKEIGKVYIRISKGSNNTTPTITIPRTAILPKTNKEKRQEKTIREMGDISGNIPEEVENENIPHEDDSIDIEEDYIISDEDIKELEDELEEAERSVQKSERNTSEALPLIKISDGYKKICKRKGTCNNQIVKCSTADIPKYDRIVSNMQSQINKLAYQLERELMPSYSQKSYKSSGKIDLNRYSSGKVTSRVFSKHQSVSNVADMAVCILCDESGSTCGIMPIIKNATIGLSEVFIKLKIDLAVIGFNADHGGCDASHHHYINWNNTKRERASLLKMSSKCNNYDGFSIRYASEYLKKRSAKYKLLIVLSDGCPNCHAYVPAINGIMDTKLAIKEASANAIVFGILLGNDSPEVHREMYGYNFMHIANSSELFGKFAKVIKKQIIKNRDGV